MSLELLQPTFNHRKTQSFGSRKDVYGSVQFLDSVTKIWRTITGHTGTDYGPKTPGMSGDSLYAVDQGIIERVETGKTGYGNYIDQRLTNYIGLVVRYAHLERIDVKLYDTVHMGDILGPMGNTGFSSSPHSHIEFRRFGIPINGESYLTISHSQFMSELERLKQNQENGYLEHNKRLDTLEDNLKKTNTRFEDLKILIFDRMKTLRLRVEKTLNKSLKKI